MFDTTDIALLEGVEMEQLFPGDSVTLFDTNIKTISGGPLADETDSEVDPVTRETPPETIGLSIDFVGQAYGLSNTGSFLSKGYDNTICRVPDGWNGGIQGTSFVYHLPAAATRRVH